MKAVIITQSTEERTLLTQIIQWAGLSVLSNQNFDSFAQDGLEKSVDLILLAQETAQLQDAMWHARRVSGAPIIVIADFINDDARVALYTAGADLVLVRPYSQRLLMVQAGMIAQRGGGRAFPQPPKRSAALLPVEPFVPLTQTPRNVSWYNL